MPKTTTATRAHAGSARRTAPHADREQVQNLILQALETEQGGLQVYDMAIRCAENGELREEWEKYREETANHERILLQVCERFGIDPQQETPDRQVVRHIGESLVAAMQKAFEGGKPGAAQLVAAECVTFAETKDHLNWQLLGEVAKTLDGDEAEALHEAYEEVEDQEDEHLYHTMGWCRELWIESLGLPASIPPPEEKRDVKSMIGAARAKQSRKASITKGGKRGAKAAKGSRKTARKSKSR